MQKKDMQAGVVLAYSTSKYDYPKIARLLDAVIWRFDGHKSSFVKRPHERAQSIGYTSVMYGYPVLVRNFASVTPEENAAADAYITSGPSSLEELLDTGGTLQTDMLPRGVAVRVVFPRHLIGPWEVVQEQEKAAKQTQAAAEAERIAEGEVKQTRFRAVLRRVQEAMSREDRPARFDQHNMTVTMTLADYEALVALLPE